MADPPGSGPLDREGLRERVGGALAAYLRAQEARLLTISPGLAGMHDAVTAFLLEGGKRLRPAFCYWGWRGAGGDDSPASVVAAACLELLQAGALIHDDVMDDSDTRRGKPSIHRRFAAAHLAGGWAGGADTFGRSAAILLGDLCLIWADEMLNTSGLPAVDLARAQPVYDEMRVELMAGQYLDLLEQARGPGTVAGALLVARYKSAKYTVERPLHMGAALAAGGPEVVRAYSAFGLPLGEAFQLRDDVLGVFGDPSETGKPAGDDLREGKRTVLVAMAADAAHPAQAAVLTRLLGNADLAPDGVEELRAVIRDTGALDRVETMIDERTGAALEALSGAPVEPHAAEVLAELAVAATERSG
ncbi:MAG: polyprenyl synthetase family protein [Actinomycetota bacterium]|nr:polyprenyl synthetase family protein [Actinomycetota bacterium]